MDLLRLSKKLAAALYVGRRGLDKPVPFDEAWQLWWEYRDGGEGGMIWFDHTTGELIDYDGAFDLPTYVYDELKSLDIWSAYQER